MADGTLSAVADILEKDILPQIRNFLPKETMLFDRFSQSGKKVRFNNNTIYFSSVVGAHAGVSTQAEGGDVASGAPTYDQMNVAAKTYVASHKLTWQAMKACKGQPGSLASLVSQYGEEAMSQLAKDLDRQMTTFGEGVITYVATAGTVTTLTVDNAHGLVLDEEYEIDTKSNITGGSADSSTTTDVDYFNNQATISSLTVAVDDRVVRKNCHTTTTFYEIMGIAGLIDNTDYTSAWQGVTRAGAGWTTSYVENTAATLQMNHVTTMVQMADRFGSPNFIVTSQDLQNKYAGYLTSLKRVVNSISLTGGWSGLAVAAGSREIPMAINYHLPLTEMYCLTEQDFKMAQLEPISWLNEGEGIMKILPASTGQGVSTQYQAALIGMGNLVCFNPRSSSALTNKTVS